MMKKIIYVFMGAIENEPRNALALLYYIYFNCLTNYVN